MSYKKYFKDVSSYDTVDVYRVHRLFGVNDDVLCHASKKLLLSGVRTGGKTLEQDVREARDSLNRWLEMLEEDLGDAQEKDGWTPEAIETAELRKSCSEYTLDEVLGNAVLSDWVRWVAVDSDGKVYEYETEPSAQNLEWVELEYENRYINKVDPPLNFKNCIWEIKETNEEVDWPDETRIDVIGQNGNDGAVYRECVIDKSQLDDWVRWAAVDKNGEAWVYSHKPVLGPTGLWQPASHPDVRLKKITTIAPPSNYRSCIWEIK